LSTIRACLAGAGFAGGIHVEALRRLGNVEVTAIADMDGASQKAAAWYIPHWYTDYREMIDKEKPDVIHICTPNSTHYEIAMAAMERGIAVVCEKPLSRTVEEARKLAEYASAHHIVTGINFNFRYYPMLLQMKQMVASGEVGELYTVHGSYLQDWLQKDTDYNWRLEPGVSGDSRAFGDIGSHWIDMVETVVGQRACEVMADFATFHKTRKKPLKPVDTYSGMCQRPEDYTDVPIGTEDYAAVLFHFDSGARGSCNVSQVYSGRKNQTIISLCGSKCALHWDSENSNELWVGKQEESNRILVKSPPLLSREAAGIISYPGGHTEGFGDTFKHNFKAIYAAIAKGDTGKHGFARFEDGLREMLLCEGVVQSARERQWIAIRE